jgi:DNA repair protein RadD
MTCPCCGYEFPPSEETKLTATADNAPIISTEKPWYEVIGKQYAPHPSKEPANPPSVKTTYEVSGRVVNQWLCPQHNEHPDPRSRRAKMFSDRHWADHGGLRPFPSTVDEFLERAGELRATTEIQLDFSVDKRYPKVVAVRTGEASYETAVPVRPVEGAGKGNLAGIMAGARKAEDAERAAAAARAKEELRRLAEDYIPF